MLFLTFFCVFSTKMEPFKTQFNWGFFFLQLTRWRGPGQTWRVRGNIFVAQIRSETPPDMFLILPLLCSATDTPISVLQAIIIYHHTLTQSACAGNNQFFQKKKKKQTVEI